LPDNDNTGESCDDAIQIEELSSDIAFEKKLSKVLLADLVLFISAGLPGLRFSVIWKRTITGSRSEVLVEYFLGIPN
jgi:hypothetical protein